MRNKIGGWCLMAMTVASSPPGWRAAADAASPANVTASSAAATAPGEPAQDACRRVGEGRFLSVDPARCRGVWVVYASYSGGGTWWHDKEGTNPLARHIQRRSELLQARLTQCGIRSFLSLSDWFDRFTPGLAVVHSAPYPNMDLAGRELRRAKRCGLDGYPKFSELTIVGRD